MNRKNRRIGHFLLDAQLKSENRKNRTLGEFLQEAEIRSFCYVKW